MNRRLKVGLDLDGVLNNHLKVWLDMYNRDYNDTLTVEDVIDWDWTKFVKPECGSKIYDYLNIPNLFRNLPIMEGAREAVEWLCEHCDVYICTAYETYPETLVDKFQWICEHFPWIPDRNIIFINDKGTLNLDVLIDDGPHNIEAFKGLGIVVDYPYNRHLKNCPRVKDLREIKKYFKDVLNIGR